MNFGAAVLVSRILCASVGMKIEAESGTELLCRVSIILVIKEDYGSVCGFGDFFPKIGNVRTEANSYLRGMNP